MNDCPVSDLQLKQDLEAVKKELEGIQEENDSVKLRIAEYAKHANPQELQDCIKAFGPALQQSQKRKKMAKNIFNFLTEQLNVSKQVLAEDLGIQLGDF